MFNNEKTHRVAFPFLHPLESGIQELMKAADGLNVQLRAWRSSCTTGVNAYLANNTEEGIISGGFATVRLRLKPFRICSS